MKNVIKHFLVISMMIISSQNCQAQKPTKTKHNSVKTIWEIPHKTTWQKLMWIHRSAAFVITKERPVNYDTTYIKSYYKRLVITLPVYSRLLKFSLIDLKTGNKLTFMPNLHYNLGVSVSSRWASFIFNTGMKIFDHDNDIKGKTNYKDFQVNLYNRKFTTDMFMQYYRGFYIKNSRSYDSYLSVDPYMIRADVNAINMGVSSYYILNHKRFSYGNSFAFVEQQKKKAGSLLIGAYYSYFEVNGSRVLVDFPFRNSFDTLSLIRNGHIQNIGLNLGYIYTLVFLKNCYTTISAVQGFGVKQVNYNFDDISIYHQLIGDAGKLHVRFATGYDKGRYFAGAMGMFDYYFFREQSNSNLDFSFGKFMIYIGYRFSVLKTERKILRKLKLIDYSY